jgi:hypothetical protein
MPGSVLLLLGSALSAIAGLLHLACIVFGGSWYRALGAGEAMARMADAGHWRPTVMTLGIATVLFVWAYYALAAAGYGYRPPLLRSVLVGVTLVYLLRGLAFLPLMKVFPGNSPSFWVISSGVCLLIGSIHAVGLLKAWPRLSQL